MTDVPVWQGGPSKDLQLIATALFLSFNLSPVAESLALCRFAHDSEPKDPQVVLDSFETSLFRSCAEKLHQVITETSACAVKAQAFGREGSHGFLVTQRCWDAPSFVKSFTHDMMGCLRYTAGVWKEGLHLLGMSRLPRVLLGLH